MRQFCYVIVGVVGVLFAVTYKMTAKTTAGSSTKDAAFSAFQRNYLIVYILMVAGDWLQGPYVYALYKHYGFGIADIGTLFIAGFGASMFFGTIAGAGADKLGRRNGCLAYAVIYSMSCMTKHSPNYNVLMLGRLFGGIATSLLFSAFESWMVSEHNRQFGHDPEYSKTALEQTFSRITMCNGLVAVLAGFLGQYAADLGGPVAPFDAAIIFMALGAVAIVAFKWAENYGDDSGSSSIGAQVKVAIGELKTDARILPIIMLQSFFESCMYTFVFMWTPAMEAGFGKAHLPYGLIFACFMTAMMLGSQCFSVCMSYNLSCEQVMFILLCVGAPCMAVPIFTTDTNTLLVAFCVFEAACGMYWPSMGTIKAMNLPSATRATHMNFARVPLNLFVCITLSKIGDMHYSTVFGINCVWLLLGLVALGFVKRTLAAHKASQPDPSGEGDALVAP